MKESGAVVLASHPARLLYNRALAVSFGVSSFVILCRRTVRWRQLPRPVDRSSNGVLLLALIALIGI